MVIRGSCIIDLRMETLSSDNLKHTRVKWLAKVSLGLAALAISLVWLILTPPGLLGKADALGYAVCHRISERSFFLGDRQSPLCARCLGMYSGMIIGFFYQLFWKRRAKIPPLRIAWILVVFLILFGVDGVNSFSSLFPGLPNLYTPQNWLRLATGLGLGLGVSLILMPVFHQTFWRQSDDRPAVETWLQGLVLLFLAALTGLGIYSENPLLLYPLEILSAAAIPLVLTICYALLWTIAFHRENTYTSLREGWVPLVAGFTTAMVQIGAIDLIRFTITGTWAGFLIS